MTNTTLNLSDEKERVRYGSLIANDKQIAENTKRTYLNALSKIREDISQLNINKFVLKYGNVMKFFLKKLCYYDNLSIGENGSKKEFTFAKLKKKSPQLFDRITEKEFLSITENIPREEDSLFCELSYYCGAGLRPMETINIMWSDIETSTIDNDKEYIFVNIRNSKRGKSRRIPCRKETIKKILLWGLKNKNIKFPLEKKFIFGNSENDEFIFDNPKELNERYRRFYNTFEKRAKQKEYFKNNFNKEVNLYTLRRSRGTELFENGISLATLKDWYGHSDLNTTLIYVKPKDLKDLEILNKTIKEEKENREVD